MDIAGLDKAELLRRLYNQAKPLGLGRFQFDPAEMTHEQAAELLEISPYFDYVKGRPLKISLASDTVTTALYNRDQGVDAAERIIQQMRDEQEGHERNQRVGRK